MCTYPVQPVCTSLLHIPLAHPSCSYYYLLSPNILFLHILFVLFCTFYSIAHFTLYFSFFTYIYALVLCYFYIIFICILLHCPLSGPDLIYLSLLIIPCIIYYVTNKETLNLKPLSKKHYYYMVMLLNGYHIYIPFWLLRNTMVLSRCACVRACTLKIYIFWKL